MRDFKKGDIVRCIDDENFPGYNFFPNGSIQRGKTYIIKGFSHVKELGLMLLGKPSYDKDLEPIGWKARRFEKIEKDSN